MRGRGLLLLLVFVGASAFLWTKRADLARWRDTHLAGDRRGADGVAGIRVPGARPTHDSDAGVDVWRLPPAPSGEFVDAQLLSRPWPRYGGPGADPGDPDDREIVAEIAADLGLTDVHYDPALSRAAREAAYYTGVNGRPPPEAALSFFLHASGAPEFAAAQYFTHTTADDLDVVHATVRRALSASASTPAAGHGSLRVGVGEVATSGGPYTRHVSVLTTRRDYHIDAAPRYVAEDGVWRVSGRLPPGYRSATVTVLYPDHRMETSPLDAAGAQFELRVPAGSTPGTMHVSIDGTDQRGPGKLLQLSVEVGATADTLPAATRVFVPAIETGFRSLEDAEAYAVALLQADRLRFGLPPFEADPQLTAIARAHSRDMRDHEFFGHLSPRTGLADARLRAAGYRAMMHSENLARNDTLGEAQAALMASIGHRKNILDPTPTHVGIGLAESVQGDTRTWYMTQLFAKPVVAVDSERVRAELLARIDSERTERGLDPLGESARLSQVAGTYARIVADGGLDGIARRALAELGAMNLTMSATVHAVYDLERFQLPKEAFARKVTGVGLGVHQSTDDEHGRTGLVFIFAERWRRD